MEIITEYKNFLEKNKNPIKAKQSKEYLYSDLIHYGIPTKEKGDFLKRYKKQIQELTKEQALRLASEFWEQPSFAEKAAALFVVDLHKKRLDTTDMPWIEKWMRECKGWALLDSLIIPFMPGILEKDKNNYNYLKKWIKDKDFWVRRSALLAQLLFFRESDKGDKELFFEFAKSQFDETWIDKTYKDKLQNKRAKFFIRKAVGWILREMSQKDPKTVFEFLKENKDKMSGLSFREGSRKLPIKYQQLL